IGFATYNLLEGNYQLRGCVYRVNNGMWLGSMSTTPFNSKSKLIHRSHKSTTTQCNRSCRKARIHMLAYDDVWSRIFQHTFINHHTGSTGQYFFSGLKYQFNSSCKPVA